MKYFDIEEFASPDEPDSGNKMAHGFLVKLDQVRGDAGIPFIINSGYRSTSHNQSVGGKKDSAHTKGLAVDIAAQSGTEKYLIVQAALKNGIPRIGIGKTFIHLDMDNSLPNPVIWTY